MKFESMLKMIKTGKLVTRELFYGQYIQYNPFLDKFYLYDCSTEDGTKFEYFFTEQDISATDWKVYTSK